MGRRVGRRVRRNGPSSHPSALRKRRVLPSALPFTTGHLIAGRYFVLRSEDNGQRRSLRKPARRKFECLHIAKSLYFLFLLFHNFHFQTPGQGGGHSTHSRPGQAVVTTPRYLDSKSYQRRREDVASSSSSTSFS